MVRCSISEETMDCSKPHYRHLVYKRKKKASESEEQAQRDPLLFLGTPTRPRTTAKFYGRRDSAKFGAQRRLSSPDVRVSSETEASHGSTVVEPKEEEEDLRLADSVDVEEEAAGMVSLVCEEQANVLDDSDTKEEINKNPEELNGNCFFPGDHGFIIMKRITESSAEARSAKSPESGVTEDEHPRPKDDPKGVNGEDGAKGSKKGHRRKVKKKSHRPRIMVEGKKPWSTAAKVSNPKTSTLRKQSVDRKRKREKNNEPDIVVAPTTPGKQNLSKRRQRQEKSEQETVIRSATPFSIDNGIRRRKKTAGAGVARALAFNHESQSREENLADPPVQVDEHENPISKESCRTGDVVPSDVAVVRDSNQSCDQVIDETKPKKEVPRKCLGGLTHHAMKTRRYWRRSRCVDACRELKLKFPRLYKRTRMVRKPKIEFLGLVFEIPVLTWKKRSKRSLRLPKRSNWAAVPLCNQLPERIPALLGCGDQRNHSIAKGFLNMISHFQETQTSKIKGLSELCINGNQFHDAEIQKVNSLTGSVFQNGETEGNLTSFSGEKGTESIHRAQDFFHSVPTEASEMWKEKVVLSRFFGYQIDSSNQYFAAQEYPVNWKQQVSDPSFLVKQNYVLEQNVDQPSSSGLEPYLFANNVKSMEHGPFFCHEGNQFVNDNYWLTARGASQEREAGSSKVTAAGELYRNQPPLTFDLFPGVAPTQNEAAGSVYQNQLQPGLNIFPGDVSRPLQDMYDAAAGALYQNQIQPRPNIFPGDVSMSLQATGALYQNQFQPRPDVFPGDVSMPPQDMYDAAAGALYQNQIQPRLNIFPGDVPRPPLHVTKLLYEDFIRSANYVPQMSDMGLLQQSIRPKRNNIRLLIHKMRSLDINERIPDCNAMTKGNRKQGKKNQKSLYSEQQLMVLNHAPQGSNLLVLYKDPAKQKTKMAKVDLDPETIKEWQLLMMNCFPGGPNADDERDKKWKGEREVFSGRVDLFIKRMHLLQADRKFKQWKGSVVDSVVGVFLTQNVSDHLSSNAYISLAARFPVKQDHEIRQEFENDTGHSEGLHNSQSLIYFVDEPPEEDENGLETNELVVEDQESTHVDTEGHKDMDTMLTIEINSDRSYGHEASKEYTECKSQRLCFDNLYNDLKRSLASTSLNDTRSPLIMHVAERSAPVERQQGEKPRSEQQPTQRKNKKTGLMEDEEIDWKSIRRMYTKEGLRDRNQMDSVDWEAVRLSEQGAVEKAIKDRGQQTIIAGRVKDFLNKEVKENETIDLEWLRDAPPDLVKRYLLEINGLGLKSVECIRLLALKHIAFPVDTNVGRIAVRLGWVPLAPLPNELQMHLLDQYPMMDSIQKYLWPRLCMLPQSTLYELHYQMITFGKVFCTKRNPNCNACPMKAECKHFASAYAKFTPQEQKTESSEASPTPADPPVETNSIPTITYLEDIRYPECGSPTNFCEPTIELPPSPTPDVPELIDLEDTPLPYGATGCHTRGEIPEIDMDIETFKKNVQDAMLNIRKMLKGYSDEDVSKSLVALTPENACIPLPTPRMKYYNRLRTEHVVYVLPDGHDLLKGFEKREPDDPSPYLLTVWQPGELPSSDSPPKKECNSDGSELCSNQTCSYCCNVREQNANILRGTILIPCRTAMRGSFPLNGTYFQINEVFADQETSFKPIIFPREWTRRLEKRALYCGSSVSAIFRGLYTRQIQLCFWTGYVCVRGFDRKKRIPQELAGRLHTAPSRKGKKIGRRDDE